jgi:hypothetical protein
MAMLSGENRRWSLGGYAPGDYVCECYRCHERFTGDKRALSCLPCATEVVTARLQAAEADRDRLMGVVEPFAKMAGQPMRLHATGSVRVEIDTDHFIRASEAYSDIKAAQGCGDDPGCVPAANLKAEP